MTKKVKSVIISVLLLSTVHAFALVDVTGTPLVKTRIQSDDYIANKSVTVKTNSVVTSATGARISTIDSVPMSAGTTKELGYYTYALMQKEPAITLIDTTSNTKGITVHWNHKAKLFACIPITITSETMVTANDDNVLMIQTTLPWWSIFTSGAQGIINTVDTELTASEEIKTNMKANTTAEAKAHVVHAITSILSLAVYGSVDTQTQ